MRTTFFVVLLSIVLLSTAALAEVPGRINYQGTLTDAYGVALDTTVSMTFTIYSDSTATFSVWTETQTAVGVNDGIFNVLLGRVNPLSEAIFLGAPRWLGVQVGGDPEMSPMQELVSVGYAFHAAQADTAKYARSAPIGSPYWSVTDSVLSTNDYWGLARGGTGNMLKGDGTHTHINLGNSSTTGTSGQNYEYCTVVGGRSNIASHSYATVGGGGQNTASELSATVGGGHLNTASNQRATVAGGWANTASGYVSTVGGGYGHLVEGDFSAILGGLADTITATADRSYLFGINSKLTQDSTFAVDMPHIRFGDETDGYEIPASDGASGQIMMTDGNGQVSWSDVADDNDWVRGTPDSVLFTANNLGIAKGSATNMLYGAGVHTHVNLGIACTTGTAGLNRNGCTVGGGWGNHASDNYATVAGGYHNIISAGYGAVAGGYDNTVSGSLGFVGGGWTNTASGAYAAVGGGYSNVASGEYGTVAGGYRNLAIGNYSAILGGWADTIAVGADYSYLFGIASKLTQDSTFAVDMPHIRFGDETDGYEIPTSDGKGGQIMMTDGSGQLSWSDVADDNDWVRGTPDSVLFTANNLGIARGGAGNMLYGTNVHTHNNLGVACTTGTAGLNFAYCTVGGGLSNTASAYAAAVGGGGNNTASNMYAAVAGGYLNTASGSYCAVSGGRSNTASYSHGTVAGGYDNTASGDCACVGGGESNIASHLNGTVAGGYSNIASNTYATVGGGGGNEASGWAATVAGGLCDTSAAEESFTANSYSMVGSSYSNSAAFNGMAATAAGQTRVGTISKASGTFTIDHPLDPMNKILNHYFIESPEMVLIYRGAAVLGVDGRAEVQLPEYFDALNENPMVQLTGVGTFEVFVAEEVQGNNFVIGGKPGTKVYWTVTGGRKDPSAEITKILMPVEQPKDGSLSGRSLDDDFLASTMRQLERMGQAGKFSFRTQRGRARYEESRRAIEAQEPMDSGLRD